MKRTTACPGRVLLKSEFDSQAGDIAAIEEEGYPLCRRFIIECKDWRTLNLDDFLYGRAGLTMAGVWIDTSKKAEALGRAPLVVAKAFKQCQLVFSTPEAHAELCRGLKPDRTVTIRATYPPYNVVLYRLDDLLLNVDYQVLNTIWSEDERRPRARSLHR